MRDQVRDRVGHVQQGGVRMIMHLPDRLSIVSTTIHSPLAAPHGLISGECTPMRRSDNLLILRVRL